MTQEIHLGEIEFVLMMLFDIPAVLHFETSKVNFLHFFLSDRHLHREESLALKVIPRHAQAIFDFTSVSIKTKTFFRPGEIPQTVYYSVLSNF